MWNGFNWLEIELDI